MVMVGWLDKKLGRKRCNEQKARHPPEDQRVKQPECQSAGSPSVQTAESPKGQKAGCPKDLITLLGLPLHVYVYGS